MNVDKADKFEMFWVGAYCGLKNVATGRIILKPIYDKIEIEDKWLKIMIKGKVGIARFSGKFVNETKFDEIQGFENGYARVVLDRHFGLIDQTGRIVAEPQYELIDFPSDGLISVCKKVGDDYRFGFIDLNGAIIIPLTYSYIGDYRDGLAGVCLKHHGNDHDYFVDKIGYINKKEELVFEVNKELVGFYEGPYNFKHKICRVDFGNYSDEKVKCGFINQAGEVAVRFDYKDFLHQHRNIIPAKKGRKWGIIDFKGFTIFNFVLDEVGTLFKQAGNSEWFHDLKSIFPVRIGKKWGFIDFKGKIVLPFEYDEFQDRGFFLDKYYILKRKGKWGVVDDENKVIIPFLYNEIRNWDSSSSLLAVRKGKKWGYLNLGGREVIPVRYDFVGNFNNGLVRVEKNGKRGYFDVGGSIIIQMKYLVGEYDFCEADIDFKFSKHTRVDLKGKYGVIDSKNRYIIKPIYEQLKYAEKMWLFKLDGKYGFMDDKGLIKQTNVFEDAIRFYEGLAAVKKGGSWGFVDHDFTMVIPCMFEEVRIFRNGFAAVKKNGHWGFMNKRGEQVIACKYNEVFFFNQGVVTCDDFIVDQNGNEENPVVYADWYMRYNSIQYVMEN